MTNEKDEFRWIDYGMTRKIEPKKHGFNPNVRALRALVHGGMHGLKTAYRALKGGHDIIDKAVELATKQDKEQAEIWDTFLSKEKQESKADTETKFDDLELTVPSENDLCIFYTLITSVKEDNIRDVQDQLEYIADKLGFVLKQIKQIDTVDAIQWARSYVKVGTIILDNEPERLTSVRYGLQMLDSSSKVKSIRRQLDLLVRGNIPVL